MKEILKINSITQVHDFFRLEKPKHPLISVLRIDNEFQRIDIDGFKYSLNLFQISLKGSCPFTIENYGRNSYDFQEGTMVFTAPNQVLEYRQNDEVDADSGWTILFHPDLIRRSELGKNIDRYSYFSYAANEALHLSNDEQNTVTEIAEKIEKEINNNVDAHSQILILSNIGLLLDYATRFYDRQFFTRTNLNADVVAQFEQVLREYYQSGKPAEMGIPTVQYCGRALNISPKYLSDLLRKETGRGTQDHIHHFIIEKAKTLLLNSNASISELAYGLGFEYPQYFSKMFRKKTNTSPTEFRNIH